MGKVHLIMPMGGTGSRFEKVGYCMPKPLIEIHGKPFFYWATMSIARQMEIKSLVFVVLKPHIEKYQIDKEILKLFPQAQIKVLQKVLSGPVLTTLKGIESIQDDLPIVVNDCDHMFCCKELYKSFNESTFSADGALLTFTSQEDQFSYIKYNGCGEIVGTVEKQVVSNHAICGAYVFKNAALFKNIATIYTDDCPYGECYMSGLYNVMYEQRLDISEFLLDYHVEFGTPEEYEKAKRSVYFSDFSMEGNHGL